MVDEIDAAFEISSRTPFVFHTPESCLAHEIPALLRSLTQARNSIFLEYSMGMVNQAGFEDYLERTEVIPVNLSMEIAFLEDGGIWAGTIGEEICPEKFPGYGRGHFGVSPSSVFNRIDNPLPSDFYSDAVRDLWSLDPERYIWLVGDNISQVEDNLESLVRKKFDITYSGKIVRETIEDLRRRLGR